MWILPDGKPVSIPGQHYEWALEHEDYLDRRFSINLRRMRRRGDTAIRLYLIKYGFVRVNYDHRGGRLTLEAHHLRWGPHQINGCRAIIQANLSDISFVLIRLLNNRRLIVEEEFANVIGRSAATVIKSIHLCRTTSARRQRSVVEY